MEKWSHIIPIPPIPFALKTIIPEFNCYGNYDNPNYGVHTMSLTYNDPFVNGISWQVFYSYATPIGIFYNDYGMGERVAAFTDPCWGEANTVTTRRHMDKLYRRLHNVAISVFPQDVFPKVVLHNIFNPNDPVKATLTEDMRIRYSSLCEGEDPYPLELSSVTKFHDAKVAYNRSMGARKAAITRKKNKIVREAKAREKRKIVEQRQELFSEYPPILIAVEGLIGG